MIATPLRLTALLAAFAASVVLLEEPTTRPAIAGDDSSRFVDLSLLVAPEYPCVWPLFPVFQINHYQRIGPRSAYNSDILIMDGNTGTQLDVPTHSVTLPGSGFSNAGKFGTVTTDKVPAWQFVGEACVVDCADLLDSAPNGRSDLITKERIMLWEKKNRPLGLGDVVLFRSGFSDKYYKPLPEGRRFVADPVAGKAPGWPGPDPACMEYLASRKVMTLGIDSASMGPMPDLAEPTHFAGLKHGMIWTESATGLGALPTTGAFYCMMGPKHVGDPYSEGRAFGVVGPLAKRLVDSARKKNVVDLSVGLADDLPTSWPGRGVGNHRQAYMTIFFGKNPNTRTAFPMHMFDSHAGTHLVPPAYALPGKDFDNQTYSPEVREWLREYEAKYGPRGTSDITAEKVPISQTSGPARVVDVRHLLGTLPKEQWPASPEITMADIQNEETRNGPLKAGDVVIFTSGWSDQHYKPLPKGSSCLEDPLNGTKEGWPAPGPEAIRYLASKGIRCVATDAPSLGGVDPKRALWTYWSLGNNGLVGVEFLTNIGNLPPHAYFLFAAGKIRDCHGGPGRAIALY
jgi:kynurenine formamidase